MAFHSKVRAAEFVCVRNYSSYLLLLSQDWFDETGHIG